jgi:AraC-like DNA-binding protein
MLSVHCRVQPPLDGFIDFLWYWEGEAPLHAKDIITASRSFGMQIDLTTDRAYWYDGENYEHANPLRGMSLAGAQRAPFAINAHQPKIMGVSFLPGGAFPFFGPAAHEFGETHTALTDIWGRDAERLHQRLVQAPTPNDKFAILETALVSLAPRAFEHHPAVAMALERFERSPHRASVGAMVRAAEIDQKKFIRLFTSEVGMTPKLYLRVARFERVIDRIHFAKHVDWWDIVEQYGYYDQSHFIRDFKEFTGIAPTEWLGQRGPYPHHIPLPA